MLAILMPVRTTRSSGRFITFPQSSGKSGLSTAGVVSALIPAVLLSNCPIPPIALLTRTRSVVWPGQPVDLQLGIELLCREKPQVHNRLLQADLLLVGVLRRGGSAVITNDRCECRDQHE